MQNVIELKEEKQTSLIRKTVINTIAVLSIVVSFILLYNIGINIGETIRNVISNTSC